MFSALVSNLSMSDSAVVTLVVRAVTVRKNNVCFINLSPESFIYLSNT